MSTNVFRTCALAVLAWLAAAGVWPQGARGAGLRGTVITAPIEFEFSQGPGSIVLPLAANVTGEARASG